MTEPELPPLPRVRAVLFDAGNTLLWLDHRRLAELLTESGRPTIEAAARRAEMLARPRLDPLLRTVTKRESRRVRTRYVGYFLEHLEIDGESAAARRFAERLDGEWERLWIRPPPDAHEVVERLRERGFRLGVVSNSNGKVDRLLASVGLSELFECIVDSGREGVEKPDPRLFQVALDHLGLPAEDALYVGDLLSVDVEGARGAGLHAVLIDPEDVWDLPRAERVRSLTELAERLPDPPSIG